MSEPAPSPIDALTAAMAIVPLLYSRNRMYERFKDPVVRRARSRARMVRGLLRFVARADVLITLDTTGDRAILSYRIERLRLARTVQLTKLELAVLRMLLAKGPHPAALAEQTDDKPRVDAALALLPKEAA
jgi:hypothetical protein